MRKKYLIIFVVSILIAFIFIYLDRDARKIKADAIIYYTIAENIVSGHSFSDKINPPYSPTMSREPVYPLFLSVLFYLFNKNILAVQFAQALIYALTCLVMLKVVSMLLSEAKYQFIISMIIALFPVIPSYVPYMFTEVLFTFLLALCVFSIIKGLKQDGLKWYFISGMLIGIATLCRAILILLPVFLLVLMCVHFYKKYKRIITPELFKASVLLLFGFALVVMPWMARNYLLFNKPSIALRGFSSMYTRAVKVNLSKDELKMYGIYCFSEYLAGKVYPQHYLVSNAGGYFYKPALQKIKEYSDKGISQEKADDMFKKEVLELVRNHPIKFTAMGFFEIVKLNSFSQVLFVNQKSMEDAILNTYILFAIRGFLKLLGFFIVIVAFAGMISVHKLRHEWMVLFCVIMYFNTIHFFLDSVGRYVVPIIPYYILFCIVQLRGLGRKAL
ncbi:MAG TPA: hypothetical protein DCY56_04845 [Candidatus Omnitrophica bacterium]|nr:hypothetical protein [Candidatus Omnitrophota bacterium]